MKMDRREFLKVGGMASLLAIFAPATLLRDKPSHDRYTTIEPVTSIRGNILSVNGLKVGEVTEVSTTTPSKSMIDITDLDNTEAPEYRELIESYRGHSEIDIKMNYTTRAYDVLEKGFNGGDEQRFSIAMADTEFKFDGYVMKIECLGEDLKPVEIVTTIRIANTVEVLT